MFFVGDIDDGVCGPALTITLEWSEPASDLILCVTEPDGTMVNTDFNIIGVSARLNCARLRPAHLYRGSRLFAPLLEENQWA